MNDSGGLSKGRVSNGPAFFIDLNWQSATQPLPWINDKDVKSLILINPRLNDNQ